MTREHLSAASLVKLCFAYAVAVVIFNTAPIYIGSLMDSLAFSETRAGLLCTADMLAMAVTGFVIGPFLTASSRRQVLLAGTALMLAGNGLTLTVEGYWLLVVVRIVAGIGTGLLFVYANTRVALSDNPVRLYGLVTMSATILAAIMLALAPLAIVKWGHMGLFSVLIGLALLFGAFALREPQTALGAVTEQGDQGERLPLRQLIFLSFGAMSIAISQSVYYSFAERAGVEAGLSPAEVGGTIAVGIAGSILTSAFAAWLSTRWGRWLPLAFGMGLQALFAINVFLAADPQIIQACIIGQSLTFFFGVPFLLGLNAEADSSGRFGNIGVGLFFFSLAVGPFLGGAIIEAFGYGGVAMTIAFGTTLGLLALVPVTRAIGALYDNQF